MRYKAKRDPMPLGLAIFVFVACLLLGSVFTFGMQFWNSKVSREDCTRVETRLISYEERRRPRYATYINATYIKEIAVDCADGKRYFIDGACINTELKNALAELSSREKITLLIHPNGNTVVELSNKDGYLLTFDHAIGKLGNEATAFMLLGIFMYLCSFAGLYYVVWHIVRVRQRR